MAGSGGRRDAKREALVDCAVAAIAAGGLSAIKARDLAACAGCSLGAIYNLVGDLDDLVLRANQRTLEALDKALDALDGGEDLERQLVSWAHAYAAFAARHRNAWRALFDFRMADAARPLPPWFATGQIRLFGRLEGALTGLMPNAAPEHVGRRARTLFSAVHGIVALGLDEKLVAANPAELDTELAAFVTIFVTGQMDFPRAPPEARRDA